MAKLKLPPPTPETFLAMELAYGPNITALNIAAFLGITDNMSKLEIDESTGSLWSWLESYKAFKHPHEAAALDDEHLQSPAKYNPLR